MCGERESMVSGQERQGISWREVRRSNAAKRQKGRRRRAHSAGVGRRVKSLRFRRGGENLALLIVALLKSATLAANTHRRGTGKRGRRPVGKASLTYMAHVGPRGPHGPLIPSKGNLGLRKEARQLGCPPWPLRPLGAPWTLRLTVAPAGAWKARATCDRARHFCCTAHKRRAWQGLSGLLLGMFLRRERVTPYKRPP